MTQRRLLVRRELRKNEGSLARDHLANERTFLSWVRTSLAFVGLGVLVAELVKTEGVKAEVAGLALIALGAGTAASSTGRYLRLARHLDEGSYESSTVGPILVGIFTLVVAVAGLVLVLT